MDKKSLHFSFSFVFWTPLPGRQVGYQWMWGWAYLVADARGDFASGWGCALTHFPWALWSSRSSYQAKWSYFEHFSLARCRPQLLMEWFPYLFFKFTTHFNWREFDFLKIWAPGGSVCHLLYKISAVQGFGEDLEQATLWSLFAVVDPPGCAQVMAWGSGAISLLIPP